MSRKRHISVLNMISCTLLALVVMYALWSRFDPRVFLYIAFFSAVAEIFIQIRWRMSLICKVCGFDPVLYVKDSQVAAQKVKEKLEERKKNPLHIMMQPLNLPAISEDRAEALQKLESAQKSPGTLVSRSI